jgi:putative salt-induced outer membrane protein YdiY
MLSCFHKRASDCGKSCSARTATRPREGEEIVGLIGTSFKNAFHSFQCAGFVCTTLLLVAVVQPSLAKRKDDVLVMKNGDRLTGEIRGLQHGELSFKSDYMKDSVRLDWKRVERLESQDQFIVALANGRRYAGRIEKIEGEKGAKSEFRIISDKESFEVSQSEVITIQQREASFWKQWTGSIDYGFSFSGANSQATSSASADVAYNTPTYAIDLSTSSQLTAQSKGPNTARYTFTGQYTRNLTQNWLYAGLFDALKSDRQLLNLRTIYGGGLGRRLLQTDTTSLLALGGLVYTHEDYFPQPGIEPVRNNGESFLGLAFSTFRFRTMDITSHALIFPSLTDPGRVRLSTQSNLRFEIVRRLFWDFGLYENFDSRPPITAPRNDVGITSALEWKF